MLLANAYPNLTYSERLTIYEKLMAGYEPAELIALSTFLINSKQIYGANPGLSSQALPSWEIGDYQKVQQVYLPQMVAAGFVHPGFNDSNFSQLTSALSHFSISEQAGAYQSLATGFVMQKTLDNGDWIQISRHVDPSTRQFDLSKIDLILTSTVNEAGLKFNNILTFNLAPPAYVSSDGEVSDLAKITFAAQFPQYQLANLAAPIGVVGPRDGSLMAAIYDLSREISKWQFGGITPLQQLQEDLSKNYGGTTTVTSDLPFIGVQKINRMTVPNLLIGMVDFVATAALQSIGTGIRSATLIPEIGRGGQVAYQTNFMVNAAFLSWKSRLDQSGLTPYLGTPEFVKLYDQGEFRVHVADSLSNERAALNAIIVASNFVPFSGGVTSALGRAVGGIRIGGTSVKVLAEAVSATPVLRALVAAERIPFIGGVVKYVTGAPARFASAAWWITPAEALVQAKVISDLCRGGCSSDVLAYGSPDKILARSVAVGGQWGMFAAVYGPVMERGFKEAKLVWEGTKTGVKTGYKFIVDGSFRTQIANGRQVLMEAVKTKGLSEVATAMLNPAVREVILNQTGARPVEIAQARAELAFANRGLPELTAAYARLREGLNENLSYARDQNGIYQLRSSGEKFSPEARAAAEIINRDLVAFQTVKGPFKGEELTLEGKNQVEVVLDTFMFETVPGARGAIIGAVTGAGKTSFMLPEIARLIARFGGTAVVILPDLATLRGFMDNMQRNFPQDKVVSVVNGVVEGRVKIAEANIIVSTRELIFESIKSGAASREIVEKITGARFLVDEALSIGADYITSGESKVVLSSIASGREMITRYTLVRDLLKDVFDPASRNNIFERTADGGWTVADANRGQFLDAYKRIVENLAGGQTAENVKQALLNLAIGDIAGNVKRFGAEKFTDLVLVSAQVELLERVAAFNSLARAMAATPKIDFDKGVGIEITPRESGRDPGQHFSNPYDALAFSDLGARRLDSRAKVNLNSVAISDTSGITNYGRFLQLASQVHIFTGTPAEIAGTMALYGRKVVWPGGANLERAMFEGGRISNVRSAQTLADVTLQRNLSNITRIGVADFSVDPRLVIEKARAERPRADLAVIDPNGNYRITRANGTEFVPRDGLLGIFGNRLTQDGFNAYLKDKYVTTGKELIVVYMPGAHQAANFTFFRPSDPYTAIVGKQTSMTDGLQLFGRDRGENGGLGQLDVVVLGRSGITTKEALRIMLTSSGGKAEQIALLRGLERITQNTVVTFLDNLITQSRPQDRLILEGWRQEWLLTKGNDYRIGLDAISGRDSLLNTLNRAQNFLWEKANSGKLSTETQNKLRGGIGAEANFAILNLAGTERGLLIAGAKSLTELKGLIERGVAVRDLPVTLERGGTAPATVAVARTETPIQTVRDLLAQTKSANFGLVSPVINGAAAAIAGNLGLNDEERSGLLRALWQANAMLGANPGNQMLVAAAMGLADRVLEYASLPAEMRGTPGEYLANQTAQIAQAVGVGVAAPPAIDPADFEWNPQKLVRSFVDNFTGQTAGAVPYGLTRIREEAGVFINRIVYGWSGGRIGINPAELNDLNATRRIYSKEVSGVYGLDQDELKYLEETARLTENFVRYYGWVVDPSASPRIQEVVKIRNQLRLSTDYDATDILGLLASQVVARNEIKAIIINDKSAFDLSLDGLYNLSYQTFGLLGWAISDAGL
jgi:hypothetical protein